MGRKLKALIMALVLTLTTVVSFNGSDIRTKAKDTSKRTAAKGRCFRPSAATAAWLSGCFPCCRAVCSKDSARAAAQ